MPLTAEDYPVRTKDPNSFEDFIVNWENYLAPRNDGIETGTVQFNLFAADGETVTTDLVASDISISGYNAIVWLSGGRAGKTYIVTCRIDTQSGRTGLEYSFRLRCINK